MICPGRRFPGSGYICSMNWTNIQTIEQLEEIREKSFEKPQLIFKHSIRCGISATAKNRLEKAPVPPGIDFYYLDLINYRAISNAIEEMFMVEHESPQVLMIKNGNCVYDESHLGIRMDTIEKAGKG